MKTKLFFGTLLVAATLSTPAWATEYTLADGNVNLADDGGSTTWAGDTFEISGNLIDASTWGTDGYKGAWIGWGTKGSNSSLALGTSDANVTITGTGFFGIAFAQSNGNTTVDLTNVVVSDFTGQLCVVNQWYGNAIVKLSGDQWKNVEYVFGSTTAEWAGVTGANNGNWNGDGQSGGSGLFTRGTGGSADSTHEHDTLALQGDTMLAGITGTSKDYTVGSNNFASEDFITVTTAGTKLTIAGEGTYAFYGTVGASGTEVSLEMASTGSGSQTFGGTNYLQDVTVTAGTLALDGTTNITGSVSVAANSTLALSGEVTLAETIQNSGTVTIADSTSFVLDNLTAIYDVSSGREYYELIISVDSGSLTINDLTSLGFILDGETINWTAYATGGSLYVYSDTLATKNLIWSGTSDTNTWTTNSSVTDWTIANTTSAAAFASGDNVTFGPNTGSVDSTITLGEDITAGTVNITGTGYTLSGNYTLTATEIVLDDEESGDTHTFTIAQGVTVEATTLTESAGQLDLVVNGTLTITDEMHVNSSENEVISGTGKLVAKTFNYDAAQGSSLTISVAEAEFTNIYEKSSGSDNNSNAYRSLIFGDGTNTTTATVGTMELASKSEVRVADGSTLTVGTFADSSGYDTLISGDGTFIAGSAMFSGSGTVTISCANFTADSITFTYVAVSNPANNPGNVIISSTDAVVGLFETTGVYNITVDGKLTAGEIYRSNNILNLAVNGTLYVEKDLSGYEGSTGMIYFGKDGGTTSYDQTISGTGTVNAYGIEAGLNNSKLTISVANLNIGAGGISSSGTGTVHIAGTTIGLYKTDSLTISNNLVIDSAGAGFNLNSGETLTISGVLSGSGAISMSGEGSLSLSGANTFSGGLTINAGKVVANNASALGSGEVTIKNGGQLEIGAGVTLNSATINIILGVENLGNTVSPDSAAVTFASSGDGVYALTGSGTLGSGVEIKITVDEALAALLLEGGEYTIYVYEDGLTLDGVNWNTDALSEYGITWDGGSGTITFTPEPSMFGLFFGLGAIGLVATRRRRKVA